MRWRNRYVFSNPASALEVAEHASGGILGNKRPHKATSLCCLLRRRRARSV
jgi:hypothetical protein